MNKIVHFEIPADDASRAKAFYNAAFDWQIQSVPGMGYHFVITSPVDEKTQMPKEPGSINGGMMNRNPLIKSPVLTIAVDDMDAALQRVRQAGGKPAGEVQRVGDMGIAAYFEDTEGNLMGLWQSLR